MKMKIVATALISVVMLSSCANISPMPDDKYVQLAGFSAGTQKCFEAGHIDPKLYAEAKDAVRGVLDTWTFDEARMTRMMNEKYSSGTANSQNCRQIEGAAYDLISQVTKRRANAQADRKGLSDAIKEFNASIPKPIYCNKIGTMTMCN